jgi:hypothetical protein
MELRRCKDGELVGLATSFHHAKELAAKDLGLEEGRDFSQWFVGEHMVTKVRSYAYSDCDTTHYVEFGPGEEGQKAGFCKRIAKNGKHELWFNEGTLSMSRPERYTFRSGLYYITENQRKHNRWDMAELLTFCSSKIPGYLIKVGDRHWAVDNDRWLEKIPTEVQLRAVKFRQAQEKEYTQGLPHAYGGPPVRPMPWD